MERGLLRQICALIFQTLETICNARSRAPSSRLMVDVFGLVVNVVVIFENRNNILILKLQRCSDPETRSLSTGLSHM